PWRGEYLRIVVGQFINDMLWRGHGQAFHHHGIFAGRDGVERRYAHRRHVERRGAAIEAVVADTVTGDDIGGFDHQGVAFPVAERLAHPRTHIGGPAVRRDLVLRHNLDDARIVDHFQRDG